MKSFFSKNSEFSKLVVGWLVINSTVWIYLSYVLAYLGKEQIAETLSKTIVVEILAVFCLYATKALFENLSKNNTWPDKPTGYQDPEYEEVEP